MIADLEVRAKRRFKELAEKGIKTNYTDVLKELKERDEADANRSLAPLKPAEDAILIDTSNLTIEEQVHKLYEITCRIIEKIDNNNSDKEPGERKIKIRIANYLGYCFGVKRAIQMAKDAKVTENLFIL